MISISELNKIGFPNLFSTSIGITTRCNLLCTHCVYTEEVRTIRPLSMDVGRFKALIPHIVRSGCRDISLIGGEPLLHPDIRSIIQCCKKAGLDITLYTNGTLLDEQSARFLRTYPIKVAIITFYGASDDEYSSLSVTKERNLFSSLIQGVSLLKSFSIPHRLQVFCNRFQPGLYERIKNLFPGEKSIARGWQVFPRSPVDNENQECMLAVEEGINLPDASPYHPLNPMLPLRRLLFEKKARCDCPAGIAKVHIRPDFTVTPCMYIRDPEYAFSLDTYSFQDILMEKMRAVTTRPLSRQSPCYDCDMRVNCRRCIAMGYGFTHGDFAVRTLCRMTQALIKTHNNTYHGP